MAAAPSGFCLRFTPASSSWLNLVERWSAEPTNRKLRRSAHRSVVELEADIRKWINEWNKNPRPFVWKDRRRDPRDPRRILRTNYWVRTLSAAFWNPVGRDPALLRAGAGGL
jgi:hypothetical protein